MFYTLNELMLGHSNVVNWYQDAIKLWSGILKDIDIKDSKTIGLLARELNIHQSRFEQACGDRSSGKEIMAITGIIQFYNINTGFEDEWDKKNTFRKKKAKNIYNAILFSGCSVEVKMTAKKVAKFYGLVGD